MRKINCYTYSAKAGGEAVSGKTYVHFHDAANDAAAAIKENVKASMTVFANIKPEKFPLKKIEVHPKR